MIVAPLPNTQLRGDQFFAAIISALMEVLRRGVDGTVPPIFVDYQNQRVIIGGTSASTNPGLVDVNGNVKIVGSGNGIILTDTGGTGNLCLLQALYDSNSGNFTITTTPYP